MQVVIVSGKGGTGKTTLAASFADLSGVGFVKADCDVDASNLGLMFGGQVQETQSFTGAKAAKVKADLCVKCGKCIEACRFGAIDMTKSAALVNSMKCEGCGVCQLVCSERAVELFDEITGDLCVTKTPVGILSHAEMIPGAEGSGKLVTQVRKNAGRYAEGLNANVIIDGSPGIGCAVMASVTGCDYALIVTEPTMSGFEDFKRILDLTGHFKLKKQVVINKFDINLDVSSQIEDYCNKNSIEVAGKIPFDNFVAKSINAGVPVVRYKESPAGQEIERMWKKLSSDVFKTI